MVGSARHIPSCNHEPALSPAEPWACSSDIAAWLGIDQAHLEWLADEHRHLRSPVSSRLRHYLYKWIPKRSGAYRLLETPKSKLKATQRRILHEILDRVPLHEATHG